MIHRFRPTLRSQRGQRSAESRLRPPMSITIILWEFWPEPDLRENDTMPQKEPVKWRMTVRR